MAIRLGIKCKLYFNTGNYATPAWTAVDLVGDATLNGAWDLADGNTRETPVKRKAATQLDINLSGKIRKDESVTVYESLEDAFLTGSAKDMMVLDGGETVNGSDGYRFYGCIGNWSEDQSLGVVLYKDFTIYPGFHVTETNLPKSAEVASSAPVFTAITLA